MRADTFLWRLNSKRDWWDLKANIHSGFFLTVRYGSERFLLFSRNIFNTWTVHLFTCVEQNWSKRFKKKVEFNPNFFWTVADRFRTFFFHPMRFLAMGHVTRHMFKRCKQTRCQRNISFYLNFFFFLFYYILQLCYCTLSMIFCWKPYRTDPIRFKWILHTGSEPNRTETLKKNRSGYLP